MAIALNVSGLTHRIDIGKAQPLALLENLSLEISAASQVAIVGASGCGKTTLLSLLAGLEPLQRGELRFTFNHQPLSVGDLARHSGFVFQQFHLIPELDALNNVALPLKLRGDRQALDKAGHWLERVGLWERRTFTVAKLSGGEQQRVAIARALVTRPGIVFADEPTGNLDEQTAAQVSRLMQDCCREQQSSLVMITHNPALAAQLDRVYRLQNGRLTPCR
ncbi:ABC transporter ATP-binding protein [Aliiglaciecola sp. CAU 1673]|uniref:ABC transporter ATP-binding protein n=1 Tax=Aliiglaciecola sp. CAU 1673 TaxID=3032595 RepID=UPI0023DA1E1F|nr:ABC transporter ATP-binding protein [Aliiglaciecola sp. CAU 1673]MDF2176882.1 ABC transporter ATP-binding protein [Aliiglaciecola sp. CAU 1673]